MATIKDVARVAGVSVATVSRVMNNRGYLSEAVREKVNGAMKELSYQPNEVARALHRQKSNILGLIVPSVSHPFFGQVARRLEYYSYEQGYKVLICNSLSDVEKERDYIDMLKRSQVDGIVMGSHLLDTADYQDISLPIVSLDRKLGENITYICSDNYQGGELATRHLIELGCKNLMHISGSLEIKMLSNRRTDAFINVCNEKQIKYTHYQLPDSAITDFNQDQYILQILQQNPDCDGVFATSDIIAATVLGCCAQLNKKVPQDIKVIGFDGGIISNLTVPKLTTLVQPIDAICKYCVEYLVRMINGEAVPSQTILPVALQKRGSTTGVNINEI